MNTKELYRYLDRAETATELKVSMQAEFEIYSKALNSRQQSIPVLIEVSGSELVVRNAHVAKLCRWFLGGELEALEIQYVAECTQLCPDFLFLSEAAEDAMALLSDSVANGPMTPEFAMEILESIKDDL